MSIDQSTLNGTTDLEPLPKKVIAYINPNDADPSWKNVQLTYKLRYTVHRQFVGFFTPMVFDLSFELSFANAGNEGGCIRALEKIIEPFVEGAIFMNHTSQFIVEFLMGQNFGYNRKEELELIRKRVNNGNVWYSDWDTPPLTLQNNRLFVYDMDNPLHGSMLDPRNVVRYIAHQWDTVKPNGNMDSTPSHIVEMYDSMQINLIYITAGYADRVTVHVRD